MATARFRRLGYHRGIARSRRIFALLALLGGLACRAPEGATVEPGAVIERSSCSRIARWRTTPIPAAPFADDDAHLAWTGERPLIWDREGRRAASHSRERGWTSLDDRFPGMRVRGAVGRYLVATPDGQFPQPISGLVVDAHTGETRPFAAPTKVLLEPLRYAGLLLFSRDSRAPFLSRALWSYDPALNRWLEIAGLGPVGFAELPDHAERIGDGYLLRWVDRQADGRGPVGGVLALDTGDRVTLDAAALDARQRWRGVALTDDYLLAWSSSGRPGEGTQLSRLDVRTNTWAEFVLPIDFGRGVVVLADGRVLILADADAVLLDPARPRWCEATLIPGAKQASRVDLLHAGADDALVLWGGLQLGRSGGCDDYDGPEGCDPWVERAPQRDGWLLEF